MSFLVPIVGSDIRTGARMIHHVGINIDPDTFKEISQAYAINRFTNALVFKCIFGKEVHDRFRQLI